MSDDNDYGKIAVIGISCKFPGADNYNELWDKLLSGKESIQEFTDQELLQSGIDKTLLEKQEYIKAAPIISDTDCFDADFFGISPHEASMMDPQHRLFLENCWKALEDGGYNVDKYKGKTGVFAGCGVNFYLLNNLSKKYSFLDLSQTVSTFFVNEKDFLATRVSYLLNLTGPSMNIQTACSTSLVTVHVACQNLLSYDCDMALAGGVNLKVPQKTGYLFQEGLIFSKDGHCRAFDKDASGTIFGEGVGVVLLKRYEDAVADNDPIHAVILGSSINNDGSLKVGFTAPSVQGQREVIESVYANAGISASSIGYIEAHGTGTLLGDPIEVSALTQAFTKSNAKHCALGSIKTNFGHLDTAAGIAGLIKSILIVKNRKIPPILHFKTPNPQLEIDKTPFFINTECIDIDNTSQEFTIPIPFRAGVSSFGVGGTNAHIVVEEPSIEQQHVVEEPSIYLLPVSARSNQALKKQAAEYRDFLRRTTNINFHDVIYTLQTGRKHFSHRSFVVADSIDSAVSSLDKISTGKLKKKHISDYKVTFMFSGQGTQYNDMGRQIYESQPYYASLIDNCTQIATQITGKHYLSIMYPTMDVSPDQLCLINRTDYTQVALFITEYALARLLIHWGIAPDMMIGHSIGEYVAATISGVFSLEQAIEIICLRSELMHSMEQGQMISVLTSEDGVRDYCSDTISLSVVNAPNSCVLAGTFNDIEALQEELSSKNIKNKIIKTSHAFHSHMMVPAAEAFEDKLSSMKFSSPEIPFISNVSGTWAKECEVTSPVYWADHLKKTVHFSNGIKQILKEEKNILMEIGPGNTLCTLAAMNQQTNTMPPVYPTLPAHDNKSNSTQIFLTAVGNLWTHGVDINWQEGTTIKNGKRIHFPTYPFEKKRYWVDIDYSEYTTTSGPTEDNKNVNKEEKKNEILHNNLDLPKIVKKVWQETLGIDNIRMEDNFYEIGGNSLIFTQIFARIREALVSEVSFHDLAKANTLKEQIILLKKSETSDRFAKNNSITPIPREALLPLSSPQERLWFLYKLEPNNTSFNIVQGIVLRGNVDINTLCASWEQIVHRHEILKSVFIENEYTTHIELRQSQASVATIVDLRSEPDPTGKAIDMIRTEALKVMPLEKGPLTQAVIYRITEEKSFFILHIHHIIADCWSMSVWINELTRIYNALLGNKEPLLEDLPFQFYDYAAWQQKDAERFDDKKYEQFWSSMLGRAPAVLQLPNDFKRPQTPVYKGNICSFSLSAEQSCCIKKISQNEHATVFQVLLATFFTLLYRYTNQNEILVGCPHANRTSHSDLEKLIGFFINMVPYKITIDNRWTFYDLLMALKSYSDLIQPFQDIPFSKLVEIINPPRATNHSPIFQCMFAYQNFPFQHDSIKGVSIERRFFERGSSEYDLSLYLTESEGVISGIFEYSTELFSKKTIAGMGEVLSVIVDCICQEPNILLSDIKLLTPTSHAQQLQEKKSTETNYDTNKPFIKHFEEIVQRYSQKTAVYSHGVEYSYGVLDEKATKLGRYLCAYGVTSDSLTGILVERSADMLIALLGVMKATGAYVPLDPSFPKDRLQYMIEDAGIKVLITETALEGMLVIPEDVHVLKIDADDWQTGQDDISRDITYENNGDDLAYVIYTSGSTGKPKGVAITNRSLVNFLQSMAKKPGLKESDVLLAITTISFDISALELFLPLFCGATVCIADKKSSTDGEKLQELLKTEQITIMQATPATWKMLLEAGWNNPTHLRILCGGEALSRDLANKLLSTCFEVWNMFGPTETTIWSSVSRVLKEDKDPDIGIPIDNTWFTILDKNTNILPDGLFGELCIGGDGLAREYLHRPALTSDRFIEHPELGRIYRTGNLARKRHDGSYEFLGRIDFQIKINGFRIELGEIENVIKECSMVKDAVVNVQIESNDNKLIIAYLILKDTTTDAYTEIRAHCKEKLPYYMIPQHYKIMEEFPLTANGKIDRKNLPIVAIKNKIEKRIGEQHSTETEKRLIEMFKKLLGRKTIYTDDNYFDLGGTSLLATRLFNRIEKDFKVSLPISALFTGPTISEIAKFVDEQVYNNKWPIIVPIRAEGTKKPLFLVHGGAGNILLYRDLASCLDKNQPVYGIQSQGLNRNKEPITSIEEMAAQYIEKIMKIDPDGPYYLGGYCMGGTIVYEMACQLSKMNKKVALVAMFDTYHQWSRMTSLQKARYLADNIRFHLKNIYIAPFKGKIVFISERVSEVFRRIHLHFNIKKSSIAYKLHLSKMKPIHEVEKVNDAASYNYVPKQYNGTITLFKPKSISDSVDKLLGWERAPVDNVVLVELSAYRNGILIKPFVRELAGKLSKILS